MEEALRFDVQIVDSPSDACGLLEVHRCLADLASTARAVRLSVVCGFLAAAITLFTGCGGIAASIPVAPDDFPDPRDIESLVGETKQHVEEVLGQPSKTFRRGTSSYTFYVGFGTSVDFRMFFVVPLPMPGHDGNFSKHCLLLEYTKEVLTSFEVEATTTSKSCLQLFWTATETKELKESTVQVEKSELMSRAQAGDREAAFDLAYTFHVMGPLIEQADELSPTSAYKLYARFNRPLYSIPITARWLCLAADQNHGVAQSKLAYWFRPDVWSVLAEEDQSSLETLGITPDAREAYMWYTLADQNGADDAIFYRNALAINMTKGEVELAEEMARGWKSGRCASRLNLAG